MIGFPGSPRARSLQRLSGALAVGLALVVGLPTPAGALTAGPTVAAADLAFTVVSTSPVYEPGDGSSVVFTTVRNDTATTLSLANDFTVSFLDTSGALLGTVSPSSGLLSSALRAVPPGQLADVTARLPGATAGSALVTDPAAAGSPYFDPRLPLSGVPVRTAVNGGTDAVSATVVNTSGYPDLLHVVVLAVDSAGDLLGALTVSPSGDVPSGGSTMVAARYVRLPGEPVADHYDVLAEGLPDGLAATSFTAPSTGDVPTSGTPVTLSTRLLDGRGAAISGALVELSARRPGKPGITLAHARTDIHGRVAVRAVLPAVGEVQLVFDGDATHAPVSTGDFGFRLHPRLTVSGPPGASGQGASGQGVAAGAAVVLKGLLPDYRQERITLQELVHGRWRGIRNSLGDRSGNAHFLLHPAVGRHSYRLSVAATGAHLAASSASLTVQIL